MRNLQLSLFEEESTTNSIPTTVVNVSSVPKRSPFRYLGGKTWLIPIIRKWLSFFKEERLIEPFCGGGIVSLTAICEMLVSSVIMVEKDENVAAVWKTILEDSSWLKNRILSFEMTSDNVNNLFSKDPLDIKERAFQTIVQNRTNHGGIMAKGAGRIKNGENGKGLTSRWYPKTLSKRIDNIQKFKPQIEFYCSDAFNFIHPSYYDNNTCFFIDPPYTIAGRRLYSLNEIDHDRLFDCVSKMSCRFLMTYDKTDYVISLINKHGLQYREVPMQTTHLEKKYELLICDDFSWLD